MYSVENFHDHLEAAIFKQYPKNKPISVFLETLNKTPPGLTEDISIKYDFIDRFKKDTLLSKDIFMNSIRDYAQLKTRLMVNFENERFVQRLKKRESTQFISKVEDLKNLNKNEDLLLICSEKTKHKILENKINLTSKTFEGLPSNSGIIASKKDFLSKSSICSFNINSNKNELKISLDIVDFKNDRNDYGACIFDLEERGSLNKNQIEQFIRDYYKITFSYEFKLKFEKNTPCMFFEI